MGVQYKRTEARLSTFRISSSYDHFHTNCLLLIEMTTTSRENLYTKEKLLKFRFYLFPISSPALRTSLDRPEKDGRWSKVKSSGATSRACKSDPLVSVTELPQKKK